MDAWKDYQPVTALQHLDRHRRLTMLNASLVDSAVALTTELVSHLDLFDAHLAHRRRSGRPDWHGVARPHSPEATAVFISEIHALTVTLLHGLRNRVIADPAGRLRAYDAIDLANWRAGQAHLLLAPTVDTPALAA